MLEDAQLVCEFDDVVSKRLSTNMGVDSWMWVWSEGIGLRVNDDGG